MMLIAVLIATQTASTIPPKKVTKTVEVDSHKYKVVWKGSQAEVSRKGMFFKADAAMHLEAIRAAEMVSGCRKTDVFTPSIGMVEVALDCQGSSPVRE
ncbi:hypothetical protein QP179_09955 [Sphingomonas aurantiaca]|uniref:hypothetical protein n=1 Tax=Sphingomonas aurantiaca TaxID=185949 RepID=UPI002FE0CF2C